LTTALHAFAAVLALTFVQPLSTGGWVSFTVTVNEQLTPLGSEQVTVVVPFEKNVPEAGEQVMGQSVVGAV
jgi:hypothetical protein